MSHTISSTEELFVDQDLFRGVGNFGDADCDEDVSQRLLVEVPMWINHILEISVRALVEYSQHRVSELFEARDAPRLPQTKQMSTDSQC